MLPKLEIFLAKAIFFILLLGNVKILVIWIKLNFSYILLRLFNTT